MQVIKAPDVSDDLESPTVFFGGSIDMGSAENWQDELEQELEDLEGTILNPRRDDWDSSWKQDPTPGTQFYEQVVWELDAQNASDIIVYYFAPDSKSPITLLELGLFAHQLNNKLIVYCPEEFYRYGNVAIVCDEYNIDLYTDRNEFINGLIDEIEDRQ